MEEECDVLNTFAIVATNHYINYAATLISDLEKVGFGHDTEVIIFTDNPRKELESKCLHVKQIRIPSLIWPDITLFRFHIISKFKEQIRGRYFVWIDADMRIVKKFNPIEFLLGNEICLSRHPGYSISFNSFMQLWRKGKLRTGLARLRIILKHKLSDQGWEINKESAAYVPLWKRKVYVQGGFWISERSAGIKMASTISESIETDLLRSHVPIYHDETYLNWFYVNHKVGLMPFGFVGVPEYEWLTEVSFVDCVDKDKVNLNLS